jgi:sugar/nucleoside kinase (ribokinase family)
MKNVLVYGDIMIDRNWIVSGRTETTVQRHADVMPMRRIASNRLDDSLGGAGMTAAAVAHLCARYCKVHLLGASAVIDSRVLGSVTPVQIPRRHFDESVTTTKLRIYNVNEKGLPVLRYRFDQDAPPPELTGELPNNLPSPSHLIISDFKKGAVQPPLLETILERFPDAEVFVDTKDSTLLSNNPKLLHRGGLLFLNRQEATRLWQHYRNANNDLDITLALRHCLEDLLEIGQTLVDKLSGWDIVIKLDKDGAVLFHDKSFYVQAVSPSRAAGIGAGDVLLASWLQGSFLGTKDRGQLLAHATTTATAWVEQADNLDTWNKAWEAGREAPVCADIPVPTSPPSQFPMGCAITKGIEEERARATYPKCIAGGVLDLRIADFGLGKVRILNPARRRDVVRFVREVREYLARGAPTRPFNCVLAARPGTGKSFLLRQLETPSLPFYEVNLAQFASATEFMGELARIAAKGDRQRILMIDEADTKLSGHHVYSLLLAPLWDGTVMYQGESRSLGSHFVSVLVTSTSETPAGFRQSLRDAVAEKGPDLESRLSGADLTLTAPRGAPEGIAVAEAKDIDADYAILIGSIVRRYYPHVRWVCRGFIDMLYEKNLSPRNLEYTLLRLEPPADGYIRPEDVIKLRQALGDTDFASTTEQASVNIQIIDVS